MACNVKVAEVIMTNATPVGEHGDGERNRARKPKKEKRKLTLCPVGENLYKELHSGVEILTEYKPPEGTFDPLLMEKEAMAKYNKDMKFLANLEKKIINGAPISNPVLQPTGPQPVPAVDQVPKAKPAQQPVTSWRKPDHHRDARDSQERSEHTDSLFSSAGNGTGHGNYCLNGFPNKQRSSQTHISNYPLAVDEGANGYGPHHHLSKRYSRQEHYEQGHHEQGQGRQDRLYRDGPQRVSRRNTDMGSAVGYRAMQRGEGHDQPFSQRDRNQGSDNDRNGTGHPRRQSQTTGHARPRQAAPLAPTASAPRAMPDNGYVGMRYEKQHWFSNNVQGYAGPGYLGQNNYQQQFSASTRHLPVRAAPGRRESFTSR